jgi:hypothetical protein
LVLSSLTTHDWSGAVLGKLLQWLCELEEDGLPTNVRFVPEDRVVVDVSWDFDEAAKTAKVTCLQPVMDLPGDFLRREKVVSWP